MDAAAAGLWPAPKRCEPRAGSLRVERLVLAGAFAGELAPLAAQLPQVGAQATTVHVERGSTPAQGYRLEIAPSGISIVASDGAGARHALATLIQLARRSNPLPCLALEDAPDFAVRGLMLDVSRTKVPTLATLFALADELALLKLNQLQLYTEHTFAYRGHEEVWRDASPLTGADIEALDARCQALGIELVPNQQSFGHMHRWLVHERYRPLAEVPEGVEHAFSIHKEPFALCPLDPRSLALLEELYDQLLPHFTSGQLNVGLDETFDLGLGRSRAECERRGKQRVYLEFLQAVHARVQARGKRMQFWGDIIVEQPALVRELPGEAVALAWGYEAGHPFDAHARLFAESGLEFYVCPGTSSWQSVGGRVANMRANTREAARAGAAHGARGYLVTDWGDRGHLQPLPVSFPGILQAAECAWNARSETQSSELAAALDAHVFREPGFGAPLLELGRAAEVSAAHSTNGTALFFLLAFAPQGLPHARLQGLTHAGLLQAEEHLQRVRARFEALAPQRETNRLARAELLWACDVLACAARFGRARIAAPDGSDFAQVPRALRAGLHEQLTQLIGGQRELWPRRYRPGGLTESCGWLLRAREVLGLAASG